jgi:tape measure domain-containing protein
MAQNPTVLAIQARIDGLQGLNQLKSALRGIGTQAKSADNDLTGLVDEVVQFAKATGNSINSLEAQKRAFEQLKRSVEINGEQFKRAQQEIKRIDQALDEARGTVVSYSKNSINALRAQKQELLAVRDAADLMSKEFKDASIELSKLDKKLAKAERRGGAGGRLRAGAQIVGTAAAAGVFGGPEGAIGALGGGIIGGPGGAILGAAVFAQVGQLRKAAGGVAEYVAELNLAKATLAGVSKDQVEYNRNLEFAREISGNYAIRLKDVIQGYASVAAAAKANNLSIEQTQSIYEGITASGIAFGKSQEDLQALFLATTQVLSKGKASAEEISGQIGERIPGAVAKFAEATERSLPELAKAFQDGKVTIADFVRFAQKQGEDYAEFAKSLAEGPEKAGLRLQIALDNSAEIFGGFFQKIGSSAQDWLKSLVDFVNDNEEAIKEIVGFVVVAYQDITSLLQDLADGIGKVFGPVFKFLLKNLDGVVRGAINAINTLTKLSKVDQERLRSIQDQARKQVEEEFGGPISIAFQAGAAQTRFQEVFDDLIAKELSDISLPPSLRDRARSTASELFTESAPGTFAQPRAGGTDQGTPDTPTPTRTSGRTPDPLVALRRQQAQQFRGFEASFADAARLKLKQATADLTVRILNAEKEGNRQAAFGLKQDLERERLRLNIEGLSVQSIKREKIISEAKAKGIDVSSQEIKLEKDKTSLQIVNLQYEELLAKQDKDRLEFNKQITKEIEGQKVDLEQEITNRRRDLGLISDEDFTQIQLDRERTRLQQRFPDQPERRAENLDLFRRQLDPGPIDIITKKVTELKDQLKELTNIGNIVANSANVIGDAFSQSFTDLITGSKSAKEALADFFKSVGSFFLDLAKQVIAKLIQIAILNAITGLLPGLSGGGGLGGGSGFLQGVNNPLNIANSSGFNLGGFFADGGRPPINKPSIVGERGPELFVPFQQGTIVSNEDLQEQMAKAGVSSMERSSSSRFRETREVMVPFTRSAEQLSVASAERETAQAISNPEPLDVRFESQVINNVEYVTADQYRKGMSQAAERGRALTLEALQNSVKARKRIGL